MPFPYRTFLLSILLAMLSARAGAQVTISGPGCVVAGISYTYTANGNFTSTTTMQWCVPVGASIVQAYGTGITNSATCTNGTSVTSIVVVFNAGGGGPVSLSTSVGNATNLNVSVVNALNPGTISANGTQTIAYYTTPAVISCAAATYGSCSPNYQYQWQQSSDKSTWTTFAGMTGQNLDFGTRQLLQTTYYRRQVLETSTGKTDYSDIATITVNPPFSSTTISPASQDIFKGQSPAPISGPAATGGSCGGAYTYVWQFSTDGGNTYQNIANTNSITFSPGALYTTTSFRRKDSCSGQVSFSNSSVVNAYDHLSVGPIGPGSSTISYNADPGLFTGGSPTGGMCSGQYKYQWQLSQDGINFTDVPGANTSLGYDPGTLSTTSFIRRKITCASETGYSNTDTITVNPQLFPGTLMPLTLTIPAGAYPGTLTADLAKGGNCNGNFTYQWQQSSDGSTFTDIAGAKAPNYAPGMLSTTMYYRRKVSCGIDVGFTNICTINISNSNGSALNYIQERSLTRPGVTDPVLAASLTNLSDVKQTTRFFDGLGRMVQTVSQQETPLQKDMVAINFYDKYGREPAKYLPYASPSTDGGFKGNGFEEQNVFNAAQFPNDQVFYGRTDFESSPLNRVRADYAPGNSWAGSDRGTTINYWSNTAVDGVRIWTVTDVANDFGTYATTTTYAAGQLNKHVSTDENGHQIIEFTDFDGRMILKKMQLTATSDDGTGRDYGGWLSTYYVYDNLGNLRAVFQPAGVALLAVNNWDLTYQGGVILTEQCFRYEYDGRDRMIMKKVPGAGPTYTVYDMRDRPVFSQDANLRASSQWLSTQYDALNRMNITGIMNYSGTLAQLQQIVNAQTTGGANTSFFVSGSSSSTLQSNVTLNADQSSGDFQATQSIELSSGFASQDGGVFVAEIVTGGGSYVSSNTVTVNNSPIPSGLNIQPLTVTFYDDYSWVNGTNSSLSSSMDPSNVNNSSYFLTSYNASPDYAVPINAVSQTKGMVTGSMALVLGSNSQFLYGVSFYDDRGRVVQTQSRNFSGGKSMATNQYDFSGKLLRSLSQQEKAASNPQYHTILHKFGYDAMGRAISAAQTVNSMINGQTYTVPEQLINSIQYNELGQAVNKSLGSNIETMAFAYNVRGWLTSINKNYLTGGNSNYFGMELGYDNTTSSAGTSYASAQFNGNIAGMVWKGAGDGIDRKYDFTYDAVNRLTGADFNQQYGAAWQKTDPNSASYKMDFSVSNLGYDANGNIMSMTQQGFKLGSSSAIDQLTYQYNSASNKLASVNDQVNDPNSTLGDFHYKGTKQATDYSYDLNGNLTVDNNKGISNIVYNILNLPQTIIIPQRGTITYTYDATGNKLSKTVTDNTLIPSVTTTTTYLGDAVYSNDQLQFIGHQEGRVRWAFHKYLDGSTAYGFEYDYFLKDHLGNTRVVLTQQKDVAQYMATMETANQATENALFYNLPQSVYPISSIPGTYPPDNTTNPNNFVARVNGSLQKVGPAIILKVMAGDKFDLAVKSFYHGGGTVGTPNSYFTDALSSLANGLISITGGTKGSLADLSNPTSGPLVGALNGFSNTNDITPPDRPKAYLNWIVLDEQFRLASSKAYLVGAPENATALGEAGITVPKSGYLYIWVSNETPAWDVFFDNLSIKTYSGPLIEETHYYPFGLTMAGISDKALKSNYAENKYRFNKGSELQNKEFADGSGLEMYETHLRELDPQLGRWWQIDSKPDYGESPYSAMGNNPILRNDPLGDTGIAPVTTVGAVAKGTGNGLNQRYQTEPKRGSAVTGIRDTQAGKVSNTTGKPKGDAVIRIDEPHGKVTSPHINLNPKLTGVPDPHTPISATTLKVLGTGGRILEGAGKVALPVAIATDAYQVGVAVKTDIQNGTVNNTIETTSRVGGGWVGAIAGAQVGGEAGAAIGAAIGSIVPGAGTVVGGAIGGFIGGLGGGIAGAIWGSNTGESLGKKLAN